MVFRKSEIPQFAVVVSKKKLPTAVDRNDQKRRVYSLLSGLDVQIQAIFFMEKESFNLSKDELLKKLKKAIEIRDDS